MDSQDDGEGSLLYRPSSLEHHSRRKAFEKRFGRRGLEEKKETSLLYRDDDDDEVDEDDKSHGQSALDSFHVSSKTPNQQRKSSATKESMAAASPGRHSYQSLSEVIGRPACMSPDAAGECTHESLPIPTRPLPHDQQFEANADAPIKYYRVTYRGIANILSQPHVGAPRTGSYLGYGEVFSTSGPEIISDAPSGRQLYETESCSTVTGTAEQAADDDDDDDENDESTRHQYGFILVDSVLTGGYAMDSSDGSLAAVTGDTKTPRRSNTQQYMPLSSSDQGEDSEKRIDDNQHGDLARHAKPRHVGYLLRRQHGSEIVEELQTIPVFESGHFLYQIMAASPLPILTGPSLDAPKTKAVLLPGTVHDVSLRISLDPDGEGTFFLRLSHRRGWIADRTIPRSNACQRGMQSVPVVKEISGVHVGDDSIASRSMGSSVAISSVSGVTLGSAMVKMRHRPPRRHRGNGVESFDKALPRQIVSGTGKLTPVTTPVKGNRNDDSLVMTPLSNVSMMSDDGSIDNEASARLSLLSQQTSAVAPFTKPNALASGPATSQKYYLMRVTAPRGLKILDAPQTQVNSLIHGKHGGDVSSSHTENLKPHQSIFQTMSGRLATTGPNLTNNGTVFDSNLKTRILPFGVLFEASRRMENTDAYSQGAGLIKLSDASGWAIVPRPDELDAQHGVPSGVRPGNQDDQPKRSFEEVGNAVIEEYRENAMDHTLQTEHTNTVWVRVYARGGARIVCPPPVPPMSGDNETASMSSSHSSSFNHELKASNTSRDSDVASSVGSSFLDAMFRTPTKKTNRSGFTQDQPLSQRQERPTVEPYVYSNALACGTVVEVEHWMMSNANQPDSSYARLRGGQGWIPLLQGGNCVSRRIPSPETRHGSFWFRVQAIGGIKVRLGPSKRAPSIKSEDGVYFRFECGEFLRASEVVTIFNEAGDPIECFAKLYRNRHVRLFDADREFRSFASLAVQAEWVNIYDDEELFLEECALEPRIERHKQGWRYIVQSEAGVAVRRGPTFTAATTGAILHFTESVAVTERVRSAGDKITWLRKKDGSGWVHDLSDQGDQIMVPHTLRQRVEIPGGAPLKRRPKDRRQEIAYNTIIARLFHNDGSEDTFRPTKDYKGSH